MWILPKNLHTSAYVQDTEVLISDLNELSVLSEQSLLVRSKPLRSATWLRKWKQASLNQHLFGRILKPSHGSIFVGKWTSSVEAFLVNPSLVQETKQEIKIQDTCGLTSSEELRYADLPFFSLRTSKESSGLTSIKTGGQTSKAHQYCFTSLESWNVESMHRRGEYSQREKLEHHTSASGSSYLLKQMNSNNQVLITSTICLGKIKTLETTLEHSVTYGQEVEEYRNTHGSPQEYSPKKESKWSTPLVLMVAHPNMEINSSGRRVTGQEPRALNLIDQVLLLKKTDKEAVLNPRWVETLMGLPIGWVSPNCTNPLLVQKMNSDFSEMELSQEQQNSLSRPCGDNSTND